MSFEGYADEDDSKFVPAFSISRDSIKLLPFSIRMKRLEDITGWKASNRHLNLFYKRRYQLGDYNYALGIPPDLSWTTEKMISWMELIKPICNDSDFKSRFKYPNDIEKFISSAYGREPTVDELVVLKKDAKEAARSQSEEWEYVCIAVLSSVEMLCQ